MTQDLPSAEATAGPADEPTAVGPTAVPYAGASPARGSTSVMLIVSFAMSIVFLFAITALMAAPAGGCGGG
jgi:hypothetical protein